MERGTPRTHYAYECKCGWFGANVYLSRGRGRTRQPGREDSRTDGTGRKRVPPHGAHVSDFRSLPRNVLSSSEPRPPPLSPSVSLSLEFPPTWTATVYPATIICHRHLSASVLYTFVRAVRRFSINYTTVLDVL